jgi:hypothetical protein
MENLLFENPETAKYILDLFLNINDQMDNAIRNIEKQVTPDEYKAFKRAVGHVMYETFEQAIVPICRRHPSLKPPEMENS